MSQSGDEAIGRSKGGLSTKIHALVDALGNPLGFVLTPGQAHDGAMLLELAEEILDEMARHATRQNRQKFPRRNPPRGCYHLA
jgi:transposase